MLIYPAIDLQRGRCVRLKQGRFDDATVYDVDPLARIESYAAVGAQWAHVVDLDGARAGAPRQHTLICDLAAAHQIRLQAGGGIRTRDDVAGLLERGVARVIIGSAAARQHEEVQRWLAQFDAESICIALDVKTERDARLVAVDGWARSSGIPLAEALALYPPGTIRHVLVTDVSRDGMMRGPDVQLVGAVAAARPDLQVQASGGIASLADLAKLKAAGASGAIIGRALYEGAFTLEDAIGVG